MTRLNRFRDQIVSLLRVGARRLRLLCGVPRAVPLLLLLLATASLFAWWSERDARRRQEILLQQLQRQAARDLAQLQARVAAALREARAHAQQAQLLQARRAQLARDAARLQAESHLLERDFRAQAEQVAGLPTVELANRLAAQLGLSPEEFTVRAGGLAPDGPGDPPGRPYAVMDNGAVPSPNPAEGVGARRRLARNIPGGPSGSPRTLTVNGSPYGNPDPEHVTVFPSALRKMETALLERDACHRQLDLSSQRLANCGEQLATASGALDQQTKASELWRQALADQEQIMARREAEHRAELKAARGPWLRRFARASQYVALGIIVGVLVR